MFHSLPFFLVHTLVSSRTIHRACGLDGFGIERFGPDNRPPN